MKKIKLLLIGLLIWNFHVVFGQICGTLHSNNQTIYPQENLALQAKDSNSSICINVFFHIIRNTNGSSAFSEPNLNDIVSNLNKYFSPINITINNLGFDYINNTNYVDIGSSNEANRLGKINNKNNAINFYITRNLWKSNGYNIVGVVVGGLPNKNLYIRSDQVLNDTAPHELGHCLNLYHTHKGLAYNDSGCAELIDGSNCSTCGDYVCDTPADNGQGNTNGYSPDLTNIMFYYHLLGYDLDHFTNGQGNRMRYAIQNEPILQNIISNSCAKISKIDFLCPSQNKTVALSNIGNSTTSWSTSSNIQTLSNNNSSITFKAINNNIQENAWVKANLSNGIIFKEKFWIGKPEVYTGNNPYTICAYNFFQNEFYTLPVSPGAKNYKLISNSPFLFVSELTNSPGQIYMNAYRVGNYSITLTTSNECGSSQATIYINAKRCGQSGFEFRTYPNPTTSNLTIENTLKKKSRRVTQSNKVNRNNYELYDFNANLVLEGKLEELTKINVSNLKRGTYFLKIRTTNNIETHQIIIK